MGKVTVVSLRLSVTRALSKRDPAAARAVAQLVTSSEVPDGDWRLRDERTWRTGATNAGAPWAERAQSMGSVTAWRSFEETGDGSWVWLQTSPLASAADADEAMRVIPDRLVANLRAKVTPTAERDVEGVHVAGADVTWAREIHAEGKSVGQSVNLLLAVAAGRFVVVASLSGSAPSWESLARLVERQLERLAA
jgi:hypothetical protein